MNNDTTDNSVQEPAYRYVTTDPARVRRLVERALALQEREIEQELSAAMADLKDRYREFEDTCWSSFLRVRDQIVSTFPISHARELYIGALVGAPSRS